MAMSRRLADGGQVAGQLHEIRPAAVILKELYEDYLTCRRALAEGLDR